MRPTPTFTIIGRLADVVSRHAASVELAERFAVDEFLLFVRDPELGVLLPAPGFPQTGRGGAQWRAFLKKCSEPGLHRAEIVDPASGTPSQALAYAADDGTTLVLIGGAPDADEVDRFLPTLPLLSAILRAENVAQLATGEAKAARAAARHAEGLARALDAARSDLEKALADAARLNDELQEADRRKDEFLAMLGHELRNPMAAISSALELMQAREGDTSVAVRARAIIDRQAQQLSRLIDDLLDVARVTRGKIVLRVQPVDVREITRRAIETARPLLTGKNHALHVPDGAAAWANADPTRLEQMITNLLTNAAKYTDPGGRITIAVEREGADVVVRVSDSGIGIAPEMLARVFDPFFQVSQALERSQGGMGMGLTLVRHLAVLHGGRAEARSEVGKGSEFSLRLPALEDASPVVVRADRAAASPLPRRVLVVDDNLDSAEMVSELLAAWGHDARRAGDGPSAVEMARTYRPDVVLLDIGLPGLNGYEVARALRQMPETTACLIVAVSGYGAVDDREKSRAAGMDAHLVKPVDFAELQKLLARDRFDAPRSRPALR